MTGAKAAVDYSTVLDKHFSYGIVIDAGSSGSRLHIYKWLDGQYIKSHLSDKHPELLTSVPQIISNPNWNKKTTPGLSFYGTQPAKIWQDHLLPLVEFAKTIIPLNQIESTPIFIQATAGMRLLSQKQQKKILTTVCSNLKENSGFLVKNCQEQVQIIDGEIEGIYGWLSLNYLSHKFNNFHTDVKNHNSLGFMDMGGASAQIAFVPSNESEIVRHADDLYTVRLRSVNGDLQDWNVFVSTWLGFGANQARRRYLKSLVSLYGLEDDDSSQNLKDREYDSDDDDNDDDDDDDDSDNEKNKSKKTRKVGKLNDPCSPKGLVTDVEINGKVYSVQGIGNYDMCLKEQYPLLLKNLPCLDDPCLFNGVHVPEINFEKDKFVGISEYWYTINDIFNLGGTYNFQEFNRNLKKFCESDWQNEIIHNFNDNKYNGIKLDYLKDSCFKGSWVVNILHEGFNLPRIDFEQDENDSKDQSDKFYFSSAAEINGYDLSWTLGKIVLYASSKIPVSKKNSQQNTNNKLPNNENNNPKYRNLVGIAPSDTDQQSNGKPPFIPGNFEVMVSSSNSPISNFKNLSKEEKLSKINFFFIMFIIFAIFASVFLHYLNKKVRLSNHYHTLLYQSSTGKSLLRVHHTSRYLAIKAAFQLRKLVNVISKCKPNYRLVPEYTLPNTAFDNDINLEEGLMSRSKNSFVGGLANPLEFNVNNGDNVRSNNHSYLNFNFRVANSPVAFPMYKNSAANNSAASLYSVSGAASTFYGNADPGSSAGISSGGPVSALNGGDAATAIANGLNINKSSMNLYNNGLDSPQLRSRVSLFNLNSANSNNNKNDGLETAGTHGPGTLGSAVGPGVARDGSTNFLNIYKSPHNVASTGSLNVLLSLALKHGYTSGTGPGAGGVGSVGLSVQNSPRNSNLFN